MKLVFFANHHAILPVLEHFHHSGWVQAVISTDRLQGQNLQIRDYCSQSNIPFHQVTKTQLNQDVAGTLNELKPDLALMLGFSYRIPENLFSIPALGFYNVHFSLLPAYKGPDPVFWQIRNGEAIGGISIHKVKEAFDDGEVVMQQQIPFIPGENWGICNARYTGAVYHMLLQFVQSIEQGKTFPKCDVSQAPAYYKWPEADDLTIDWEQMSATEIENLVNAANPCYSGAITFLSGQPVQIMEVSPVDGTGRADTRPGTIVHAEGNGVFVQCLNRQINLPDLRGRVPVGIGTGPGLSTYQDGQKGGETSYVLNSLPKHKHILQGVKAGGTVTLAAGNLPANIGLDRPFNNQYSNAGAPLGQLASATVGFTGSAQPQPFSTMQPYLPLNYIICMNGEYPLRDDW